MATMRHVRIPNDADFDHLLILGFVLQTEREACGFTREEVARKCLRGARYMAQIEEGNATTVREWDIFRICRTLDITREYVDKRMKRLTADAVHNARKGAGCIWAGGNQNPANYQGKSPHGYLPGKPPRKKRR